MDDKEALFPVCYLQGTLQQPQRVARIRESISGRRPPRSPAVRPRRIGRDRRYLGRAKQQPAGVETPHRRPSIVSDYFYQWKKQLERVRRQRAQVGATQGADQVRRPCRHCRA